MSLDPVLSQMLEGLPPPPTGRFDYADMRAQAEAMTPLIVGPAGLAEVASVEDGQVDGPGGAVPIRIYRPVGTAKGTLHYIHGGGWAIGNLAIAEPDARRLCRALGMVVVSSTYRLAPEHPFPAAFDDTLAASKWVLERAADLDYSLGPVVIAGDSAGANLAAAVCLALRGDDSGGRGFDAQLLLYPAVDLRPSAEGNLSRVNNADPMLTTDAIAQVFGDYVGRTDPADWRISPAAAKRLGGLPPALVVVLSVDPLRDEAVAYADRLEQDGVTAELIEFDNLVHGFVHLAGVVPAAAEATDTVVSRLKALIGIDG